VWHKYSGCEAEPRGNRFAPALARKTACGPSELFALAREAGEGRGEGTPVGTDRQYG
jgi:hypothetical protein